MSYLGKFVVTGLAKPASKAVLIAAVLGAGAGCSSGGGGSPSTTGSVTPTQAVTISGNQLLRDGALWVPHAVQLVAFVAPPKAQTGAFAAAYAHYNTAEIAAIKAWGADCIRFQLSQPGADPSNALYDSSFVATYVAAVQYARSIGLNAIISIQDEPQSGETEKNTLPTPATIRVWQNLLKLLKPDNGIIYELYNEPQLTANAAGWQQWATAMNGVLQAIRSAGATNAILADGLQYAETLNGMVPLTDPLNKVFYSSHPYYHSASDELQATWATKFGNAAATVPVIVGEWAPATTYYTDANTAAATLQMLQYMQSLNIGLVAVTYDFGLPKYGGIVSDYMGTPTSFANGLQPGDAGWGPGTVVQNWYRTGQVPSSLE